MADDAYISACMKAKVQSDAPCPANRDEFFTWLHVNAAALYWGCGGYSEGGIGSHEAEIRALYDQGKLTFNKCAVNPGSGDITGLLILGAGIAALYFLSRGGKKW